MRQHIYKCSRRRASVEHDAIHSGLRDGCGAEEEIDQVHEDHVVPENNLESTRKRCSSMRISFIEFGFHPT